MTGTGTSSRSVTQAFTRTELLIRQINLIVQGTTGSASFKDIIQKGVENRWIEKVFVRGLTSQGKILQQIEIEIDWKDHVVRVNDPSQGKIEIRVDGPERNWLSASIGATIDGFNDVTQSEGLKAEWIIYYTPEANARREEVNRILGLVDAEPGEWVSGIIEPVYGPYRPKKLQELQLSWRVVRKY